MSDATITPRVPAHPSGRVMPEVAMDTAPTTPPHGIDLHRPDTSMPRRLKPYRTVDGALVGYTFCCPGCKEPHYVPTEPGHKPWGFNGDIARPTFAPSILIFEARWPDGSVGIRRCHSFVRDGKIEFLSDCGHALAGQTVDLPEVSP